MNQTTSFATRSAVAQDWQFHIGGYQVCEKWHKDRRGRKLACDDLTDYPKVVVALKEIIRLMKEIDAAIRSGRPADGEVGSG